MFSSFDHVRYVSKCVHGVCYGDVGDNLPSPAEAVQLCTSRNIRATPIYRPNHAILAALRGSGIGLGLILDVGGVDAVRDLASSAAAATAWVRDNVQAYYPAVLIRYVAVGNEVSLGDAGHVLAALAAAGLSSSIRVSTSVRFDVVAYSYPPSRADNPRDISLAYATFQPGASAVRDTGSGLVYTNLFHAMVDALYAALERARAPGVRVVVSETGWPSGGGFAATVGNARRYNQDVIDNVYRGTPRRPGVLETYNPKPGDPTEKNFGLFYPDMQPVYPINFPN
ncbi:hypothetical protein BS78_K140100 [Paspalum vaginatum]|uniref:Glucan endo-1,3-beta-D-glucosidase n=1 Tax=Paspalum vaginatum TaxID=158149 RepID=A0A9W8CFJ5_9POAL|nr:hypothetical protein BS78_K140100 [Paspalum vaginatum]